MVVVRCVRNCCLELDPFQSWFGVEEHSPKRPLDVRASFTPTGVWVILAKLACLGYNISTQVLNVVETKKDSLYFYAAYYTHWALGFACIYGIMSVINSIFPIRQQQPSGKYISSVRIRLTWLLFAMVIQMQFITTIIYWTLVWDGDTPEYMHIAPHGPVFLAVLIDGFHINRIPLRWMHLWAGELTMILFIIWSIIHGPLVLDLGNPNQSSDDGDPDDNDDAIYAQLSWKEDDIARTTILVLIIMAVVVPLLFAILRAYSRSWFLFCGGDRRRYFESMEESTKGGMVMDNETNEDKEEDATEKENFQHQQYGVDEENPYLQESAEEDDRD